MSWARASCRSPTPVCGGLLRRWRLVWERSRAPPVDLYAGFRPCVCRGRRQASIPLRDVAHGRHRALAAGAAIRAVLLGGARGAHRPRLCLTVGLVPVARRAARTATQGFGVTA